MTLRLSRPDVVPSSSGPKFCDRTKFKLFKLIANVENPLVQSSTCASYGCEQENVRFLPLILADRVFPFTETAYF